ncbi:Crp/Fnr family transcriptional regulator [Fibrobacterota bacterium]
MQNNLTTIEKVIFLQDVDVFEYTSTEDLSQIAAVAQELHFPSEHEIFREGEISDSMYLVLHGKVLLHRNSREIMIADAKKTFGSWALFDDEPRMVTAECKEDTCMLRIDKEEFLDLLAHNVRITQGILRQMAHRLRSLIGSIPEVPATPQ